ncbi:MAG: TolC family protein [Hyphomicrobiales bacterium]
MSDRRPTRPAAALAAAALLAATTATLMVGPRAARASAPADRAGADSADTSVTAPGDTAVAAPALLPLPATPSVPAAPADSVEPFGSVPAGAEEITMDEAVELALRQNPSVLRAGNTAHSDALAARQQKWNLAPNLQASARGTQNYGRFFSQEQGQILNETSQAVNLGVSSSMTLFDGFGNIASIAQSGRTRDASRLDLTRARQTAVFTVISQFLSHLEKREQLRVQRANLTAQRSLLDQIQAYVTAGRRPVADLYQQQASVASADLAVVNAERDAAVSATDLIQTLDLDPTGAYRFTAPAMGDSVPAERSIALDDLLGRALRARPDLNADSLRVLAARQGVRLAKSDAWPSLTLSGSYGSDWVSTGAANFGDQLDQRRSGSISLGLGIPIFDRLAARTNGQRAQIQADNARLDAEATRQEVALEVRQAYLNYRAAHAQHRAADAQVAAAEQALQAVQDRYQAGVATLVELSQARATGVAAESASVSARFNVLLQSSLLDYYTGVLDPDAPLAY